MAGIHRAFKSSPVFALPCPGKGVRNKRESDQVTLGSKLGIAFYEKCKE